MDTRNIADRFKGWTTDLIRKEIKKECFPYAALMENWQGDFNLSSLLRNGNALGASEIYYIGKKRWDRRGAVGVQHYTDLKHLKDFNELETLKEKYVFVGVDNIPGSVPMESFEWPKNTLMIFGEEGIGLTPEMVKMCQHVVYIKQYGSVRSLNAACAWAISFYDYIKKVQSLKMKVIPKDEEHLGGTLCYPCQKWIVYSRQDIVPFKTKIYKVDKFVNYESGDGNWEEVECSTIVCPECNRRIYVTVIH